MARRWVVLTAARASGRGAGKIHEIIEYTEWAGRTAAADEVIYTDPMDAGGSPADKEWQLGGTVTLAGVVYTYTAPAGQGTPDDLATDTGRLRAAVRATHEQLIRWAQGLNVEGMGHPAEDVNLGHSYLAFAHQWVYLVSHNHRVAGQPDWTANQRIAAIQQIALGASDVTSPVTFYSALHQTLGGRIGNPTAPCGWVDVGAGDRVELHEAIEITNTMMLDVTQLPTESIIAGMWIEELTA